MIKSLQKILVVVSVIGLTGCSTETLFVKAIDHERSNANLELKSIDLDFGKVMYLDNNVKSDSTIVLLHGFGGDKDNWNRFSAELDGKHHIIVPDLPGHGESVSDLSLDYSIANQTKMLSAFLDAIHINSVHMVGNSMGGAVAISYTHSHPAKVKTLSLIDALGLKETKSEYDLLIEKGENPMLNVCTEEAFEKLVYLGMNEPPYIPGIFMDMLVAKKCARSGIEKHVYDDMIQDSDLSDIVSSIKTPTVIIWGKMDRIIHVDNSELFHKAIKGSKLVILDRLGHVPLLEEPEKTAREVEKLIN